MSILILAEHDNETLSPAISRVLSAAKKISGEIDILVAGFNCGAVAQEAAKFGGVRKILLAEDARYAHALAEPLAALLVLLSEPYDALLAPSSTSGKNIMPRVAALLDVPQISDIVAVTDAQTFVRPIYAGNAMQTVQAGTFKKIITVRASSFAPAPEGGGAVIETVKPEGAERARFVSEDASKNANVDLGSARVVISGGRGLGTREDFARLETFAKRMGWAVGASRAAVDAGFVTNDHQVGQTGKVVAPELYIAVGISGAIQHLAGMKDSKIIVAINKDENAPIFSVADYGLVADWREALPALERALEQS